MRRLEIPVLALSLVACKPRKPIDEQCQDVVEHMRHITAMPMREGDVMMFMGACKMWRPATIDCLMAAGNDDDIKRCRDMEK